MMKLPHLEDAFNAVFVAIEKVPGVNFTQINPEEIEGQTLLAIAGLAPLPLSIFSHSLRPTFN